MNFKYEVPESVVIVRNEHGATATIRYKNPLKDKIVSSSSPKPSGIYKTIEDSVMGRVKNGKKEK